MMDGSYVPPFRRHQAAGDSGDAPQVKDAPNHSHLKPPRYGASVEYEGRRRFQSRPVLSNVYRLRDIQSHFWGSVEDARDSRSSTFHDSKDHPEQLSHLLLFRRANPRWANNRIVFAKSKLALLPEYAVKKAENGEWETEKEDQHTAIKAEGNALISSPPPSTTISRMKYTDIRKEEAEASQASQNSTTSESNTKYADIRTIPASQFYEPYPLEPVFPAIASIDYVPTNPPPIAVFEEQRIQGRRGGIYAHFAFKGWFKISRINILAPHSAELVRMLQQKWGRQDRFGNVIPSKPRDASAWNASLAVEWAVVAFQLLEGEDAPPPPQIKRLPESDESDEPEQPVTKSVNEMLLDMRLNDAGEIGQRDDHHATEKLDENKVTSESGPGEGTSVADK